MRQGSASLHPFLSRCSWRGACAHLHAVMPWRGTAALEAASERIIVGTAVHSTLCVAPLAYVQGCGFQKDGSLVFLPPDGEFTLLNYRISSHFRPPLVIIPTISETGADTSLRGTSHTARCATRTPRCSIRSPNRSPCTDGRCCHAALLLRLTRSSQESAETAGAEMFIRVAADFTPDKHTNNLTLTMVVPTTARARSWPASPRPPACILVRADSDGYGARALYRRAPMDRAQRRQ